MTQEEKDISVALFDKEVESFCKETFIKDEETKGLIFCCARHFTDWQKQQTIDKVREWIVNNVNDSLYYNEHDEAFVDTEELITKFKEEMEDVK